MPHSLPHDHGTPLEHHDHLPKVSDFATVADLFKKLDDSNRLRIFWLLCHGEECVINLSAMMEMSSPAVSHHLKILREAGLVETRRDGKEVYYKAAATPAVQMLHLTIENIMHITCP